MRVSGTYDLICADGGLSSYLLAAMAARSGLSVLVIDRESSFFKSEPRPFYFDYDLQPFWDVEDSIPLKKCFHKLGLSFSTDRFLKSTSILQLVTPQCRLTTTPKWEETRNSILREFSRSESREAIGLVESFSRAIERHSSVFVGVKRLGEIGPAVRSSLKKEWPKLHKAIREKKSLPLHEHFGLDRYAGTDTLVRSILAACGYAVPENVGAEQAIRSLPVFMSGRYWVVGGLEAIKRDLSRIIRVHGGDEKHDAEISAIINDGKQVTGVQLSTYEGVIGARHLVIGGAHARHYRMLPEPMRDSFVQRAISRVIPHAWKFTVGLLVDKHAVPHGATSQMVGIEDAERPLLEENCLHIQVVPDEVAGFEAADSRRVILLSCPVAYAASALDPLYLRKLAGRMVRKLFDVMPFVKDGIHEIYPDFTKGEERIAKAYPFSGADWMPDQLLRYHVQGSREAQEFWGIPIHTRVPNMHFVGKTIWPSLGTYGEILSAVKAYQAVTSDHSEDLPEHARAIHVREDAT